MSLGSFISNIFSPKQTTQAQTSNQQQAQQAGTSQSNLWPQLGGYFNTYASTAFNPAPFNPWQTDAAGRQGDVASGLGTAFGAANTAASGANFNPTSYQPWMSPWTNDVAMSTLGVQGLQKQQDLSALRGNMAVKGALGNNVGTEAAYLAGRAPYDTQAINQIYQQGFNTAQDNAYRAGQYNLQGAQTAGALTNAATGANQAGFGMGQTLWQNPLNWMTQGAAGLSPFLAGAGQNYSGTSSGNSSGSSNSTTTNIPSPWQIGTGILGTAMSLGSGFGGFGGGGTVGGGMGGKAFGGTVMSPFEDWGRFLPFLNKDKPEETTPAEPPGDAPKAPGMGMSGLDLMQGAGLPMGGLMDVLGSKGMGGGLMGVLSGGGGLGGLMGRNTGGSVGGSSFADKVKAAHAAVREMHNAGGRVGFDTGGKVSSWDSLGKALTKGSGTSMAPIDKAADTPSGSDRVNAAALEALARSGQSLQQFMAQQRNPLPRAQGMGFSSGGAPRWNDAGPEGVPVFTAETLALPAPMGAGAPTPFEAGLARLNAGARNFDAPQHPDWNTPGPGEDGPAYLGGPPPAASPAQPNFMQRRGRSMQGGAFDYDAKPSPMANFGRGLMAASGPLVAGNIATTMQQLEQERMARQLSDRAWASLSGRLPDGQRTLDAQRLGLEAARNPAHIAQLEAHSESAQKRIKEFEYKTQKDLAALEQLRKTESDVDSAVMYGAITPQEGEQRRQAARQLYLRSREQIQDVTTPPGRSPTPAPGSTLRYVPGSGVQ